MKDKLVVIGIVALIAMVGIQLYYQIQVMREMNNVGSVAQGNDYFATSTKSVTTGISLGDTTLKTTGGTLARVTITGAAAGTMNICNATTSDITQRAATQATSSMFCITIPASAEADTYDFDAVFPIGIILDMEATAPTSTIMWR